MKTHWIVIRIVFVLFAIFALGVWVGRMTAPQENDAELVIADGINKQVSPARLDKVTRRALRRYTRELELTRDQVAKLRPLFYQVSKRMEILPKHSKARLAVIEDFHEQIVPYLTDEQKVAAVLILKKARERERTP